MVLIRACKGVIVAAMTGIVLSVTLPAAAQTSATIAGTMRDEQGAGIPGATITLISETRGTTFEGQSSDTGDYVLTNLPGDTYTIRVAMDGFKTAERKGVPATPGDRVAVPPITIGVGAISETVLVTGDAPMIQSQTGERSFTISKEAVENLPVTLRYFGQFAALAPGVITTGTNRFARIDGARTNYMLDGISSVNTGGNQPGLELNADAIAEVKVVASAYQAEYGRSTGIQISGITKSGTNQFHGSLYDIERQGKWNSNTWANVRNGNAKAVLKEKDWGYTIGGPVGKPGGQNRLFFFYSEQFSPRTSGGAINRFRVPTLLERRGDFSESTDNTGNRFNFIRDASTGLPCVAGDTRGCFQADGVLGRIPQNRLYDLGLNILKTFPEPNTQSALYSLETVAPTVDRNTFQHVVRVDYQASSKLRLSAKYAGQNATVQTTPGSIPGFNDTVFQFPAILVPSATVVYTVNSSTVLEGTYGLTQGNQLGNVPMSPVTNRNNVGLGNFPLLYPNNGTVPAGSYQEKVLQAMAAPYYINGRVEMAPSYVWAGRIPNSPPNNAYPPFLCMQNTHDVAIGLTKLWGSHTFKVGYQSQDSMKLQNLGTVTFGALPFEGRVTFTNDSNNPLDSGFPYANAALGVFSKFEQQNALFEGDYVYHNKDFYIQDNWKVNGKLTLDLGIRFTHHGPQYDVKQQASNFFPDQWSSAQAPRLYVPGCASATGACVRVAVDPVTGANLGPGSSVAIGTIVPNTGNRLNGIIQAGNGIAKENYEEQSLVFGPRVGAAYDWTGTQKIVLRGSFGIFYDRLQGDSIFGQIGNPPTGQGSTVVNSTLEQVARGTSGVTPAPVMLIYDYDAKIGGSASWNGGVQMTLPWYSTLDVSYVGVHNYNSVSFGSISVPPNNDPLDLNAPDIGAAYLSQNQDPTSTASAAIPGARALPTDLMRPYRGLGAIIATWPRFYSQYDSMQTSINRRFRNGWQGGLNWTLSLRNKGDLFSPLHLQHNADGTIGLRPEQDAVDEVLSNAGIRRHLIKGNFVWNIPNVTPRGTASQVLGAIANDWQISGVFSAGSGAPYDATFQYQSAGTSVNLTGSPNYRARIRAVGDIGSGCSSDQYAQFNAAAFAGPTYNSIGDESGANLLNGCWDHTTDLSVARNIRVGGSRQLQFRVDVFNAFNSVVLNARNSTVQFNSPATPTTITNSQYLADGSLNPALARPANAGAGAATAAQAMRTVQMQLRFSF